MGRILRGLGLERQFQPLKRPAGTGGALLEQFFEPSSRVLGERVTVDSALSVATVYACIRILAETVGSTPLMVYREGPDAGNRTRARTTPIWQLLHEEPNPALSPTDMWTLLATWVVGWGDAFLGKQFALNGEVVALWPLHPKDVEVGIVNGRKVFRVRREDGRTTDHTDQEIIQVMGQSFDGIRGASPIQIAKTEIATSMAAQRYAGSIYTNAAVPRGALQSDHEMSDEAIERLRQDWNRIYGGTANAGKIAILEDGLDFKPISMPMKDVQFVEQQQLSVQVIARIFRVPLSLIQADSPGGLTYRTAETENLQFLVHGVRPWYIRFEQALNRDKDLFPSAPLMFSEFLPADLLRTTTQERFAAYQVAVGNKPWMLPSEVRAAENLPANPKLDEMATAPPPAPVAPAQPGQPAASANGKTPPPAKAPAPATATPKQKWEAGF